MALVHETLSLPSCNTGLYHRTMEAVIITVPTLPDLSNAFVTQLTNYKWTAKRAGVSESHLSFQFKHLRS